MKRKLLFALCALLIGWSNASAASTPASATYSDPYSVTVSNGNFENSLTGWTVEANNAGFVSHEGNGGHIAEIYNKKNAVHYIKRTITGLSAGHYRLYFLAGARGNTDTNKVYAYIGDAKIGIVGEPFASYVIDYDLASDGSVEIGLTTTNTHQAEWVALDNVELKYYGTTAAYKTALNQAYLTAGSNMTSFIRGADFSDGISCFPQTSGTRGNSQTGSYAMESWNNNNVTYAQTIAIPNGKYRITVDMISGNATKNAYLFATSGEVTLNSSVVSAQSASGRNNYTNMCEDVAGNTLTIDNFAVTNGSLTLGIKDPSSGDGWVVFDNFTLTAIEKDVTFSINNAAVTSTTGWTNGRISTNQQYTGAPDNTYMDTYNGNRNQNQTIQLPAGYYLLKAATRAHANVTVGNIYASDGESNLGSTDIHHEGSSGNLLGNGWAWTRVPFSVDDAKDVKIGFYSECGSAKWAGADDFHLTYYTSELEMKKALLNEVVSDANAWAGKVTTTPALETALAASAPTCSTVEECNTAITNLTNAIANARATSLVYPEFVRIKNGANSIKDVEYTEITPGCYSTFTSAITTQTTNAESATTVEVITSAISVLKSATKTYINGAEPKNDGEYFDITCLMENPDFADNTITGWTKESTMNPNTRIQCNEFFGSASFDFYQTVSGLPNGSYTLGMKAFQRPGGYNDVYAAWNEGINNATAKIYVNSDESDVKNIMAEMNATRIYTDPAGESAFNSDKMPTGADGYIPNSMEGASAWFAADKYKTEVAALVEDGSLKLGFKDAAHSGDVWTLFDEFRLHYYGSSKLVYYKQYLPQLKTEVSADLSNGAYANVLVSSEDEALDAALAATPTSETEEAYKTVIDNLKTAQTAFRAAAPSYDAMVAAKAYSPLTKVSANIGTGVFQYNEATNNTLFSAYETAKSPVASYTFTTSSTAAGAQTLVDALDDAIEEYNNQPLNPPTADTHYKLTLANRGALTFKTASTEGSYGLPFMVASDYLAQTYTLTAVGGKANTYTLSFEDLDGNTRYICTRAQYGTSGTGTAGIRTFVEGEEKDALEIKIQASSTANVFYMLNTERDNEKLGAENDGDLYTIGTNSNWSIAEASQATVRVSAKAGKYGTIIFPFTPDVSEGFDDITFYSCNSVNGENESVAISPIDSDPKANTPYIIKNTGSDFSKVLSGWGTAAADSYADAEGLLTGIYTTDEIPAGNYVLQTQDGVQKFYVVDDEEAVTGVPYRAYLTAPGDNVKVLNIIVDGTATGVDAPEVAEAEEEEGVIYNTSGQVVTKDYKGIVIKNGKKYYQK